MLFVLYILPDIYIAICLGGANGILVCANARMLIIGPFGFVQALLYCLWLVDWLHVLSTMECMEMMESLPCELEMTGLIFTYFVSKPALAAGYQQSKGPFLHLWHP